MREIIINTLNYRLYANEGFDEHDNELVITSYQGRGSTLKIPAQTSYEGREYVIRGIGKKAFLGAAIREIELPLTITDIDDWAFAQCDQLSKVVILRGGDNTGISFGRGVFSDCKRIQDICIGDCTENSVSKLAGAIPHRLKAEYLLSDNDFASEHWFAKWDTALLAMLDEDDVEGYTNIVLCGEEDIQRSLPEFIADKRKKKSALCLLRLLYDDNISGLHRDRYTRYLNAHSKGSETEEAWEVILSDFGDSMEYYNLFAQIGCITTDNIDAMLADMGEQHAEAKAYLIDYKQKNFGGGDIFSAFEL